MEVHNKMKCGDVIYLFIKKIKKQIFYTYHKLQMNWTHFLNMTNTTNMQILKT